MIFGTNISFGNFFNRIKAKLRITFNFTFEEVNIHQYIFMRISKQSSNSVVTTPPPDQPIRPAQYLIPPFKIYILTYLLSELQSAREQQCIQAIRRSGLHLQLSTNKQGKRKSKKIRTEWDLQPAFPTKQEQIFEEEKDQIAPIYRPQYSYFPQRKGYDAYRYKANAGDCSDKRYLYSEDYHQESASQSLTNQRGSYEQYQHTSPYRKKRNTAFVDQGKYEDKGLSIILKDIPTHNLKNSRQKQEDNRKLKMQSSKIISIIIRGPISRHLSFSFMRIHLSSTLKKYQLKYAQNQGNSQQTQTQTDKSSSQKTLHLDDRQSQQAKMTRQLGKISTIFFKINAIYQYILSISFLQLKRVPIVEIAIPIASILPQEEMPKSQNRCVPIDSSGSDEQEVTIKYIDDEGISANSTFLTSMSVLSFGEGGSSQAPISQRSRETDVTLVLE